MQPIITQNELKLLNLISKYPNGIERKKLQDQVDGIIERNSFHYAINNLSKKSYIVIKTNQGRGMPHSLVLSIFGKKILKLGAIHEIILQHQRDERIHNQSRNKQSKNK